MVDQNSQFYAILTNVGAAKQANADALGIPWKITQMGVGDANGADPTPNATQTSLINEWRRAPLNQLKVDDKNSAIIVAEQVIPADVGGKWIREIALYDADGDLVAVANCAPTYKPLLSQGSGRTQVVRMNLIVSSASNVQLKIDPAVVLATREWVTEELARQDFKHSVQVATTAAISLSGLQVIDGVALQVGARVLVKNQAAAKDNGLYLVAAGAWVRCTDADTDTKVTPGLLVLIERGVVNGDSAWQLVSDGPITLGVSAQDYEMAFGRSGVGAGTYRSVTVDKYGRVTAASNPTTAAGYGLTDVYTKAQVDSALLLKAPLANPVLTGDPKAPTPPTTDNDTSIATTAFVRNVLARYGLATNVAYVWAGNIDQLNETGLYISSTITSGTFPVYAPTGETIVGGMLLHLERDSEKSALQFWESVTNGVGGAPGGLTFKRSRFLNGTWSAWAQLWDSLNTPKMASQTDNTPGRMVTSGAYGLGVAIVNGEVDLNKYTVPGNYMTPIAGMINLPTGWANGSRRYSLVVNGFNDKNYLTQTLTSGQSGAISDPVFQAVRVMSDEQKWSPWRVLASTDSPALIGNPVAPTPGRGDISTRLATTEFVKESGFTLSSKVVSAAVGSTLTAEHVGRLTYMGGVGAWSGSLQLPSSGIATGSVFTISVGDGDGTVTIKKPVAAGGYISIGSRQYDTITIRSNELPVMLMCVSDNIYTVIAGGLSNTPGYSSLIAMNGWAKNPNGLIEQWGTIYLPANISTANIDTVFPLRFPNGCLSVVASIGVTIEDYDRVSYYRQDRQSVSIGKPNTLGFDGQVFCDTNPADGRTVQWRAIGF
ncbi:hypothetical protein CLJ08_18920 [Pseudomonas mosselii]|nr:hypothetical protein CLJ08_18920 [Pseudomonas mosselii]